MVQLKIISYLLLHDCSLPSVCTTDIKQVDQRNRCVGTGHPTQARTRPFSTPAPEETRRYVLGFINRSMRGAQKPKK